VPDILSATHFTIISTSSDVCLGLSTLFNVPAAILYHPMAKFHSHFETRFNASKGQNSPDSGFIIHCTSLDVSILFAYGISMPVLNHSLEIDAGIHSAWAVHPTSSG